MGFSNGRRMFLGSLLIAGIGGCGGGTEFQSSSTGIGLPPDILTAVLTRSQIDPAATGSGSATSTVLLDPASRTMTITVMTSGIAATAVHLVRAQGGQADAAALQLVQVFQGAGVWSGRLTLSEAQLQDLRSGGYRLVASSPSYPDGEIGGRILPQSIGTIVRGAPGTATTVDSRLITYTNVLTGTQVVPLSLSAAIGTAMTQLDMASRTLFAVVTTRGMTSTEVHLHQGLPGTNGPILFSLGAPLAAPDTWLLATGLAGEEVSAVVAGSFYFEAHSLSFPRGEVRGQLRA